MRSRANRRVEGSRIPTISQLEDILRRRCLAWIESSWQLRAATATAVVNEIALGMRPDAYADGVVGWERRMEEGKGKGRMQRSVLGSVPQFLEELHSPNPRRLSHLHYAKKPSCRVKWVERVQWVRDRVAGAFVLGST